MLRTGCGERASEQRVTRAGAHADPLRFMAGLETLASVDYSLCIKAGVHFTLCGGTIAKLGTAKHHAAFLPRLDTLDLPGCFGMTELGHGSNVMGIETTARPCSLQRQRACTHVAPATLLRLRSRTHRAPHTQGRRARSAAQREAARVVHRTTAGPEQG